MSVFYSALHGLFITKLLLYGGFYDKYLMKVMSRPFVLIEFIAVYVYIYVITLLRGGAHIPLLHIIITHFYLMVYVYFCCTVNKPLSKIS